MSAPLLPTLAKEISNWFPELDGRSLAVSECKITAENIPTLPLVMVAFLKDEPISNARSGKTQFNDIFVVEFWMQPERYKLSDGGESPFWSFFDYEALRDRLLSHLETWQSPSGNRLQYQGVDVESDNFAIVVTFKFSHQSDFCPVDMNCNDPCSVDADGLPITPDGTLITTIGCSVTVPLNTCFDKIT